MNKEPTQPYVYQPEGIPPGCTNPEEAFIWSVAGPGTEGYTGVGQRYTKAQAQAIVDHLLLAASSPPIFTFYLPSV